MKQSSLMELHRADNYIQIAVMTFLSANNTKALLIMRDYYVPSHDGSISGQIRDMNRFWRMQLGLLDISTTEIRECLNDNLSQNDYILMMYNYFLPNIIRLDLPRPWTLHVNENEQFHLPESNIAI